jgi:hypothetical protein
MVVKYEIEQPFKSGDIDENNLYLIAYQGKSRLVLYLF